MYTIIMRIYYYQMIIVFFKLIELIIAILSVLNTNNKIHKIRYSTMFLFDDEFIQIPIG